MSAYERPHFKQPFTHGSYVEQDTPDHVRSCQFTIAACPTGFRDERPEFGWDFPELRTMPVNFGPLVDALRRFEPRGDNIDEDQARDVYGETIQLTAKVESQHVD